MFEINSVEYVIKNAIQAKKKTAFLFFDSSGMATVRVNPFLAANEEYEDRGIFIDSAEEDGVPSPPQKNKISSSDS